MIRTEEREFDGVQVLSTQLDVIRQSRLLGRLGKLLGDSLAQVVVALADVAAVGGKDAAMAALSKKNLADLAPAFTAAFERLDEAEHDQLLLRILAGTEVVVDGKKSNLLALDKINRAFDGRLATLYKVVWFALEVNYAGFFTGPSDGSDEAPAAKESA